MNYFWLFVPALLSLAPFGQSFAADRAIASEKQRSSAAVSESAQTWKKVASDKVCMVTDMTFERSQIPVQVKGSTYYGCCDNCKERLGNDASVRAAIDPVSGKSVDKSKASIAAGPDGRVAYFENDKNLETFISTKK